MDKCDCPDLDVKKGCERVFSCAHACFIRYIGLDESDCHKECKKQWDSVQDGQGLCSVPVKGYNKADSINVYTFDLCSPCTQDRLGPNCTKPATLSECQKGCSQYEDPVKRQKAGKYMMIAKYKVNVSSSTMLIFCCSLEKR